MIQTLEKTKQYRTYQIHIKKGHRLFRYLDELCLNSNNLYNLTNFYIRQVYTSLQSEKPLQPLQREVMDIIDGYMPKMNDNQLIAYQKKVAKESSKPIEERKEVKANLFSRPTKETSFVGYNFLDCLFKTMKQKDYYALPGQINQQVIKNVIQNWQSFFASHKEYKKNPDKYLGKPRIPNYLPKGGRKEVVLSNQICKMKEEKYLQFPKTRLRLNIGKLVEFNGRFQQARVIPRYDAYVLELVFFCGEQEEVPAKKEHIAGIDLGLDNLATMVFNNGHCPVLFKGGKIKSINQYYNKLRAYYMAILRNGLMKNEGQFTSKRLTRLDQKRHRQIKDAFHKISANIVNMAKENGIDTLVIGNNKEWKQAMNIGKKNNQNFVQIPHALLIELIQYKAQAANIAVIVTEESYTSKASLLDFDEIPTFKAGNQEIYTFSGKRIKRGLYKSKIGTLVNADCNGAGNIIRKVAPYAFMAEGVAAVCSQPLVVNVQ